MSHYHLLRLQHKSLLLSIVFLLSAIAVLSQDKLPIKFGKVSPEDFNISSPLIDSNTAAVVVADAGSSEFVANTFEMTFSIIFKHKTRIKIINKNGFDAATVVIPLYVGNKGKAETLESLKAYTYNLVNGSVEDTKVEKGSVYTENYSKNWIHKKFTFPAVKEGSIIEYSYEIKSDFLFNLQPWIFQGAYPVLWSQYEANIPEFFRYVIISQGYQPFYINETNSSWIKFKFTDHPDRNIPRDGLSQPYSEVYELPGQLIVHNWVMKNVPALKSEPYTTTLENHISKLEFQLNEIAYPHQLVEKVASDWKKVCTELLGDDNFGIPIKKANNWLDDITASIVNKIDPDALKAKKIYEYVRDNFVAKYPYGYYTTTNLKDVYKSKSGNVADINLLLIAMLRNVGIKADPVILSTRSHGVTHSLYPLMDRFNYVVAQVDISETPQYLDATQPRLSFGKLPPKCYNGHARIITYDAEPVYFYPDSLKEREAVTVFISNDDGGTVTGSINDNLGYYESLQLRESVAEKGLDEYKKKIVADMAEGIDVKNITLDSLKMLDYPVNINIEFLLKGFGESEMVYFNPMLLSGFKNNPFKSAERLYPVEMPYLKDESYVLNMDVPKGYAVEELPKSVRIFLNEDEAMFEYIVSSSGDNIQMKSRVVFYRTTFKNEDYQSIRDFFSFVVKKQAEQIVFKKTSK